LDDASTSPPFDGSTQTKSNMLRLIHILTLVTTLPLLAEHNSNSESKTAHLAIISIGPKPTRQFTKPQKGQTSPPLMLPASPYEIPPFKIYHKETSINIPFNSTPKFITVPAETTFTLYRKKPTSPNQHQKYITIPALLPGSKTLLILRPSGKGETLWKPPPMTNFINFKSNTLKNKNLLIKNLSPYTIKQKINNLSQFIRPQQTLVQNLSSKTLLHRISATFIRTPSANNLTIFILHNSKPNSQRPIITTKVTLPK